MGGIDGHLARATALRLPGDYVPLVMGGARVGFVRPAVAARIGPVAAGVVALADGAALLRAQAALAAEGLVRLRGEAFDVRARPDGPVLGQVDRGALPVFGIEAQGVHVNGLVRGQDGWSIWVARRSRDKALDAGKLDHVVAGGICAGMDAAGTLVKEAAEEASVPAGLARGALAAGRLGYAIARAEGLRRDVLHCYDLVLPRDFVPVPRDGEVEGFTLMPVRAVLARVRDSEDFKFNVSLVLIDLFARMGLVAPGAALDRIRLGGTRAFPPKAP
jgi:hypothetical protein